MDFEKQIYTILNNTRDAIRANMQQKGINASGRTSESVQVRKVSGGFQLVGGGGMAAPIETTEIGRGPGRVPYNFADILKEWANAKGLQIDPWAVLVKIRRDGTDRFINDGRTSRRKHADVYSTPSKEAVVQLNDALKSAILARVRGQIRPNF